MVAPLLRGCRAVLVTDANLARTPHPVRLEAALGRAGVRVDRLLMPAGEASKTMACLAGLLERMLALGVDRKTAVVALGGGVVGDLAGFAAAVCLRGLDLIQVPTTLLAQVDSSVGGKTGVDSPRGKNLIGAFHQPRLVLIDTAVLGSLPPRELRAGYAELVKHAFIRDRGLFEWLEGHADRVLAGDPEARAEAIRRSVAVKAAIVAADEHETGDLRALLNFGHTFAHAYETLTGYGDVLLHGEAVSLGMARAFALSVRLGLCPAADAARALEHLAGAGLPVEPAAGLRARLAPEAVLAVMRRDKKAEAGAPAFVLSDGLGRASLRRDVPAAALMAVLSAHA
jgi:3-dehydroquinate synthase